MDFRLFSLPDARLLGAPLLSTLCEADRLGEYIWKWLVAACPVRKMLCVESCLNLIATPSLEKSIVAHEAAQMQFSTQPSREPPGSTRATNAMEIFPKLIEGTWPENRQVVLALPW